MPRQRGRGSKVRWDDAPTIIEYKPFTFLRTLAGDISPEITNHLMSDDPNDLINYLQTCNSSKTKGLYSEAIACLGQQVRAIRSDENHFLRAQLEKIEEILVKLKSHLNSRNPITLAFLQQLTEIAYRNAQYIQDPSLEVNIQRLEAVGDGLSMLVAALSPEQEHPIPSTATILTVEEAADPNIAPSTIPENKQLPDFKDALSLLTAIKIRLQNLDSEALRTYLDTNMEIGNEDFRKNIVNEVIAYLENLIDSEEQKGAASAARLPHFRLFVNSIKTALKNTVNSPENFSVAAELAFRAGEHMENPTNTVNNQRLLLVAGEAASKRSDLRVAGGIALALIGITLFLGSVLLIAATAGVSLPVSIVAAKLAAKLTVVGSGIALGIGAEAGRTASAFGAYFVATSKPISAAAAQVSKPYGFFSEQKAGKPADSTPVPSSSDISRRNGPVS